MNIDTPPEKILLVITRRLGDVFLTTALIHSLKCAWPQVKIDVLLYKHTAAILAGNADIHRLIRVSERPGIKEALSLVRRLWRRYDVALSALAGDRPIIYALLGAPKVYAVIPAPTPKKKWQSWWKKVLLTAWTVLDDHNTHTVAQYLRLAELLGITPYPDLILPEIQNQEKQYPAIETILGFPWQKQAYVVLHPVAMYPYKNASRNLWQQLIRYFTQQNKTVVISSGPAQNEQQQIQNILATWPTEKTSGSQTHLVNIAGRLDFAQLAQVIKQAAVFIGVDTSVSHLAAATGTKTLVLFGPSNPVKWAPWPKWRMPSVWQQLPPEQQCAPYRKKGNQSLENVHLIQGKGDCVPCLQEGCDRHRMSDSQCLQKIQARDIIACL